MTKRSQRPWVGRAHRVYINGHYTVFDTFGADHVATVTEAGCRILINILLLRVVSAMCPGAMMVNIIPEFPLPRTIFKQDSGRYSFSGVIDFLVTKLPARYTEYLLGDPTTALVNLEFIDGPMTSNIFEAKRDNVRAALPQAAIAAASYCQLQNLSTIRGVVTSGEQWVFFAYERRTDGTGLVRSSPEYSLGTNLEGLASCRTWCAELSYLTFASSLSRTDQQRNELRTTFFSS